MVSIVEIVTENNKICPGVEHWVRLLPEIERICGLLSGPVIIFSQQVFQAIGDRFPMARKIVVAGDAKSDFVDVEVVSDMKSAFGLAGEASDTLVLGPDMDADIYTQAVCLYLLKIHAAKEEEGGKPGVELAGWREMRRQLHWGEDKKTALYSSIVYGKNLSVPGISVILSTYNQPMWLEKVLYGYESQHFKNFEVIIADDGSSRETMEMIEQMRPVLSFPIKHVWHTDQGFRKCIILNKGIEASSADYLLFSDGDCIPRRDFLERHIQYRKEGYFLSGGYHKLGMDTSQAISHEDIRTGRCFQVEWLKKHGMRSSFKNNKLTSHGFKEWLLNTFTPTKATWNGHNASGWRKDIFAVNGFDERMEYGGEDREMGERLMNAGIRPLQIRYSAITIHLDHKRGYVRQEALDKNRAIRKDTAVQKKRWTDYGIKKSRL